MYNIKVQQAPAEFEDEQEANDYEDDEACTELIYASHTFHTTENDKKKKKKKLDLIQLVLQTAVQLQNDPKPHLPSKKQTDPAESHYHLVHPPSQCYSFGLCLPIKSEQLIKSFLLLPSKIWTPLSHQTTQNGFKTSTSFLSLSVNSEPFLHTKPP